MYEIRQVSCMLIEDQLSWELVWMNGTKKIVNHRFLSSKEQKCFKGALMVFMYQCFICSILHECYRVLQLSHMNMLKYLYLPVKIWLLHSKVERKICVKNQVETDQSGIIWKQILLTINSVAILLLGDFASFWYHEQRQTRGRDKKGH